MQPGDGVHTRQNQTAAGKRLSTQQRKLMQVVKPLNNIINQAQLHSDKSKYDNYGHRLAESENFVEAGLHSMDNKNNQHYKSGLTETPMAPLIMKELEEESTLADLITSQESLQKMLNKIQTTQNRDLDVNIVSRDNYKLKKKVFRNSSHYFSKAQDVNSLKRMNYEPEIQQLFKKRQKSPEEIEFAQQRSESLFDIHTQKISQDLNYRSGGLSPNNKLQSSNMFEVRQEMSESNLISNPNIGHIGKNGLGIHQRLTGLSKNKLTQMKEAKMDNRNHFFGQRSYSVSKQRIKPAKLGPPHIENCC